MVDPQGYCPHCRTADRTSGKVPSGWPSGRVQVRIDLMPARQSRSAAALLFAVLTCISLAACSDGHPPALARCTTTVRDAASTPITLTARWLPAGFRLSHNDSSNSARPAVIYTSSVQASARLELSATLHRAGLHPADTAGSTVVRPAVVGDRPAFIGRGQQDQLTSVYWKTTSGYLISVVGYRVAERAVMRVARHIRFIPSITTALPVDPGMVVTRRAVITTASRWAGGESRLALAKLTSWTEVAEMVSARSGRAAPAAPDVLSATPWRPVWAVLLPGPPAQRSLVVVDAVTGQVVADLSDGPPGWYPALTDRASGGCPGGSSARLPFGVLTRTEQSYTAGLDSAHWPAGFNGSRRIVLSTVTEVNKADPGLYSGCIQQNCTISQLVWVTITTERGIGRHRLSCLPPSGPAPAGYRPHKVRETFVVDVRDDEETGCGPLPRRIAALKDLAPAAH
jgi:hypothetical protein